MNAGDKTYLGNKQYTVVRVIEDMAYLRDSRMNYRTADVGDLTTSAPTWRTHYVLGHCPDCSTETDTYCVVGAQLREDA